MAVEVGACRRQLPGAVALVAAVFGSIEGRLVAGVCAKQQTPSPRPGKFAGEVPHRAPDAHERRPLATGAHRLQPLRSEAEHRRGFLGGQKGGRRWHGRATSFAGRARRASASSASSSRRVNVMVGSADMSGPRAGVARFPLVRVTPDGLSRVASALAHRRPTRRARVGWVSF